MSSNKPKYKQKLKDAGTDGSGIFRNIARDEGVPEILAKGNYKNMQWYQILETLHATDQLEKLRVHHHQR